MVLKDLQILIDLKGFYPSGFAFRQFRIYSPEQWKSYTSNGQIRELKQYYPAWDRTDFTLIGGTDFGDAIVVTDTDPISESGGIYMLGEGFGMKENGDRPEGMLCLGRTAGQWHERIESFMDEPAISPGSIIEELGSRADEYRMQIEALNQGFN